MSGQYQQLLEATITHLERLRAHGTRFVTLAPATLAALTAAPSGARPPTPSVARPRLAPAAVAAQARSTPLAQARPALSQLEPMPASQPGPAAPVARPALSPEAKPAAFGDLRQRTLACLKCPNLVRSRRHVVFGVGDPAAELMFVGEAPGADEDAQGEPFVGAAGQLLTRIIQTMGFARDQVYIANILKCRPDTPGQGAGNRKPTPGEMATCIPWLHEQIDLIRPRVLVALGGTAVEGLLGATVMITRLRGQWREYRSIPLMPTYHPAFLLRNQALSEKRKVWEDMLAVLEKLGRPISDKQRNYFLKA
jgi:DNA polymerase